MLLAVLLGYLFVPVIIILPMSFGASAYLTFPPSAFSTHWYAQYLGDSRWLEATALSFRVGVVTAILATVLGTPAAIALGLGRGRLVRILEILCLTPMIFPAIVFAIAIYGVFVRWGLAGSAGGLWMAHTVLALPFVIANVTAAVRLLDLNICRAAESLGARPWQVLVQVMIPNIRYGVAAGALLAFVASFDEVVVALYLSSVSMQTLPKLMWEGIVFEINPIVAAVSSLFVVMNIVVFGLVGLLRGRERRRISAKTRGWLNR